jgi:hypothetical protein
MRPSFTVSTTPDRVVESIFQNVLRCLYCRATRLVRGYVSQAGVTGSRHQSVLVLRKALDKTSVDTAPVITRIRTLGNAAALSK